MMASVGTPIIRRPRSLPPPEHPDRSTPFSVKSQFKLSYQGQTNFDLKWLDRHERQADENPPIGRILCTEASRDQIELLELDNDGIVVAEYWTTLPPKAELQARIQAVYREARERIARRQLTAAAEDNLDE